MDVSVPDEPTSFSENAEFSQPVSATSATLKGSQLHNEDKPEVDEIMLESTSNEVAPPSLEDNEKVAESEIGAGEIDAHQAEVLMQVVNTAESKKSVNAIQRPENEVAEIVSSNLK